MIMNMSDNVKLMLRESQAELFKYVLVSGYDFRDFVEKYMNSNFVQQEME